MEVSRHWRMKAERYALTGRVCPQCGRALLRGREICPHCEGQATETYSFNGRVYLKLESLQVEARAEAVE